MYLGNQPALSYTSFAKQDFTTSATTSYTLDNPVANENEIALFINFVRQEPTTAYTASGTSLTLTSATSASDDMYCVFLGKAVQTVNPPNGSVGLSQLSATGTKDATTFLRGDNTFASAGGDGTPMVSAYLSSSQTISDSTWTKIQINTEVIDTDNAFDNSTNYRFTVPSGKAGKYFISGSAQLSGNNNDVTGTWIGIAINGSRSIAGSLLYMPPATGSAQARVQNVVTIQDLSVGDTVELQAYIDVNSGTPFIDTTERHTQINIFKIG